MCSIYNLKAKDGNVKVMRELAAHTGEKNNSKYVSSPHQYDNQFAAMAEAHKSSTGAKEEIP